MGKDLFILIRRLQAIVFGNHSPMDTSIEITETIKIIILAPPYIYATNGISRNRENFLEEDDPVFQARTHEFNPLWEDIQKGQPNGPSLTGASRNP